MATVVPATDRAAVIRFSADRDWWSEPVIAWLVDADRGGDPRDARMACALPVLAVQSFPRAGEIYCVELDDAARYTFPGGLGFDTIDDAIAHGLALVAAAKGSTGNT